MINDDDVLFSVFLDSLLRFLRSCTELFVNGSSALCGYAGFQTGPRTPPLDLRNLSIVELVVVSLLLCSHRAGLIGTERPDCLGNSVHASSASVFVYIKLIPFFLPVASQD